MSEQAATDDGASVHEQVHGGLAGHLGFRVTEMTADRCTVEWDMAPELAQPYGILHGGVHCAAVETAASVGAATWWGERGHVVGVANHTNFLRATRTGRLTAVATPIHRGRTQQLWQVEVTGGDGRLAARGEVRLANIEDAGPLGQG